MATQHPHDIDESLTPTELLDDTGDIHFVPAPCQKGCPIGTDAPSYIALIWENRMEEAVEAITATNPFSSSCARICAAPCETVCRRTESDGPIAIRNLKRYVMERHGQDFVLPPVKATKSETIGIGGGGPAALTAAQDLALDGYKVHVYEMSDRLGGRVAWGIPFNRLPPDVLDEDIDREFLQFLKSLRHKTHTGLPRNDLPRHANEQVFPPPPMSRSKKTGLGHAVRRRELPPGAVKTANRFPGKTGTIRT